MVLEELAFTAAPKVNNNITAVVPQKIPKSVNNVLSFCLLSSLKTWAIFLITPLAILY